MFLQISDIIDIGLLLSFKRSVSPTGLLMLVIGTFIVKDIGVLLYLSGSVMIMRKLFVLVLLLNQKNSVVFLLLLIFIVKALIVSLFLPSKVRVSFVVLKKFSIVGSNLVLCLMLNNIILSKTSRRLKLLSLLISSLKVLIKLVVGSILFWSCLLISLKSLLPRTSLLVVLFWLLMVRR